MGEVLPLPSPGEVFDDVRGEDRTMRVSHHADAGVVIVSLWAGRICRASFRLPVEDTTRLLTLLSGITGRNATASPDSDADPTAGAASRGTEPRTGAFGAAVGAGPEPTADQDGAPVRQAS